MNDVEVTIKVTSPGLSDYLSAKDQLTAFTGDQIGQNPVKEVIQQDEINFVNEIKITAEVEM